VSLTWTQQLGYPSAQTAYSLAADTSGNAVTAGQSVNQLYRSTDGGVTWTRTTDPTGSASTVIAYGNGVFLVGCQSATNICIRSTDGGKTWTAIAKPTGWTNNGVAGLVYGNGTWMAIQNDAGFPNRIRYATSADGGATWAASAQIAGTEETLSNGEPIIVWDGTNFVITGRDAANSNWIIVYSPDAVNWTIVTGGTIFSAPADRECLAYGGGIYLTAGRSNLYCVESSTLAGFASNAGYTMSPLFSGAAMHVAFTPDSGKTWFCSDASANLASTTKTPDAQSKWSAETIAIPASCYVSAMCYDVSHQVIILLFTGVSTGAFTAAFANPNAPTTPTGGGSGHGSRGTSRRHQHYQPKFGFYADQLRRQDLTKPGATRKLNWVRHDD
jgi:hypothetical protein